MNAGTWLWLSCSSFFQQFFHCYCPVRFGRKADANGDFIRKYLPVLKNFPTRYIHEPWTAPESVQRSAKCIIGQEYPRPMCNHPYVSKLNMERMKQVYNQLAQYRRTGQTGPNIPHELISQMKRVPKIPSPSSGMMGPPNPPSPRRVVKAQEQESGGQEGGPVSQYPSHYQHGGQQMGLEQYHVMPGQQFSQPGHDAAFSLPSNYSVYPGYGSGIKYGSEGEFGGAAEQCEQPPDGAGSLPVISGDILLPGPLSTAGGSVATLVEGGSTISNLSIISQSGSLDNLAGESGASGGQPEPPAPMLG